MLSFSEPLPNKEAEHWKSKSEEEYGQYLLRTNYERIKPGSKYSLEGIRPRSPPVTYSLLSEEMKTKIKTKPDTLFHNTSRNVTDVEKRPRNFVERHCDTTSEHVIRGRTATQPYCYITKEAHNRNLPEEYTASQLGAYPTWGPAETGFRTRSHYVGEPVERYSNIDLYRRPPTNQPGKIIFDYGRPNNGYFLQRNQYDNTWFGGNLKLNQTNVLNDIGQKTEAEYEQRRNFSREKALNQSTQWPFSSEYEHAYKINSSTRDFEQSLK